jgi:hypothetical protein
MLHYCIEIIGLLQMNFQNNFFLSNREDQSSLYALYNPYDRFVHSLGLAVVLIMRRLANSLVLYLTIFIVLTLCNKCRLLLV